jgi:hypothetical protein
MADRSIPRPIGKNRFLPKDEREIPEDEEPRKMPKPGFGPPSAKTRTANLKNTALARRLQAKVHQKKYGSAHEQHVAHEAHMTHVRNNAAKNAKSKNPYST